MTIPAHTPEERVRVLLPLALAEPYDYRVPAGLALVPGDVVEVPLGGRLALGVVWEAGESPPAERALKEVRRRLDTPPLPEVVRRFVAWTAQYTLAPLGAVLRMAISVPEALEPPAPIIAYGLAAPPPDGLRRTEARRRVLAVAAEGPPRTALDLAREAAVSPVVVKGLAEAGALARIRIPARLAMETPDPDCPGPLLGPEQATAAGDLCGRLAGGFSVTLLDGVPGSGKTEVYFEAVAEALRRGRQVLVLLPEIALGAQWLARFKERFGAAPLAWHSDLTEAQRRHGWRAVAEGRARVVVGARSALYLPYSDLGLIVVDEEHENAFKQEDGVIYHARDMAVVRARLGNFPIVLASATPSLETVTNVESGRYRRLHLPDRHGGATLPEVRAIDLRRQPPPRGQWISGALRAALTETLAAGEQAMLYLNRRGYAPLTLCRKCGHRFQCPRCTAWLVEHRAVNRLQCHHCGFNLRLPDVCPSCASAGTLAACGPGVERLTEEVTALFPEARIGLATSDSLPGPRAAAALVRAIENHALDVIVGTQIIAKGYHFPLLTLVGAVDADLGLAGGDLRAAERSYQLLYQVAGRAGRGTRPGRVLLQTVMPEHPVMAALVAGDRDRFLAAEAEARRDAAMPPFGRLVALIVSGRDEAAVDACARALGRAAPRDGGIDVLGPAPAPLALLRGRHRRRLLLKAGCARLVQPVVRAWLAKVPIGRNIRVQVDVDPTSFF